MDRHVLWLRRQIVRSIAMRSIVLWVLSGALLFAGAALKSSRPLLELVPWAVIGGQGIAVTRLGMALAANPLSYRFLRGYIDRPFNLGVVELEGEPHELVSGLINDWHLDHVAVLSDPDAEPRPVFDVLQSPSRVVTVAVSRALGTIVLLSQLEDGRILQTDSMLTLPNERLIVNVRPGLDAGELAMAHVRAVDFLANRGIRTVPATAALVAEVDQLEHATYGQVGPFLATFLNLESRGGPQRMTVRFTAEQLLDLSLGRRRDETDLTATGVSAVEKLSLQKQVATAHEPWDGVERREPRLENTLSPVPEVLAPPPEPDWPPRPERPAITERPQGSGLAAAPAPSESESNSPTMPPSLIMPPSRTEGPA